MRWAQGLMLVLMLAAGCKLTPDYERPELDLPKTWSHMADTQGSIANLEWWETYQDETLVSLIKTALANNQDLALALARMQEAEYLVTFTRAEQFPLQFSLLALLSRSNLCASFTASSVSSPSFLRWLSRSSYWVSDSSAWATPIHFASWSCRC